MWKHQFDLSFQLSFGIFGLERYFLFGLRNVHYFLGLKRCILFSDRKLVGLKLVRPRGGPSHLKI